MIYLVTTNFNPGVLVPPPETVVPGSDRLSWESPYPDAHNKMIQMIADGYLSRYRGDYDKVTITDTATTTVCQALSMEGAQAWANWMLSVPATRSSEIQQIPEVGDPGYVAP